MSRITTPKAECYTVIMMTINDVMTVLHQRHFDMRFMYLKNPYIRNSETGHFMFKFFAKIWNFDHMIHEKKIQIKLCPVNFVMIE